MEQKTQSIYNTPAKKTNRNLEMTQSQTKKTWLIAAIALLCAITMIYWIYGQFHTSTDNAYVNANVVQMASRVSGQIQRLYVSNNQYVQEGQLLLDLDPDTFQVAVDQAKAQLEVSGANLKLAQATENRTHALVKRKVASAQEGDNTEASLQSANANLQLAQANLKQAELNLRYTKIFAPTSGWITNFSIRQGDVVTANQSLFALVSDKEFWVDANFKETELTHLHTGQHATVQVDMYPQYQFKGVVQSISAGSGAVFSLLPPENATGNWVKVTQRIPVRIQITNPNPKVPLRIGTTATVTIRFNPWNS